jgi:hypothetical protein
MKRSLQCAFGTLAFLVTSSAWAQTFGEKGQLAISAERLFGFVHDSSTVTVNGVDSNAKTDSFSFLSSTVTPLPLPAGDVVPGLAYSQPRVAGDYFVIDHLSVGAALGYSHTSITTPANVNQEITTGQDSWTFAPRAGYSFLFNDWIGIWPRGGFTYRSFSFGNDGGHDFALTIEAPFTFTLIPHVVFTAGPTLDIGLTGSVDHTADNGATTSVDFSSTEIGIQSALIATVW